MRRIGRYTMILLVFGLFLLGAAALVDGPDRAENAEAAPYQAAEAQLLGQAANLPEEASSAGQVQAVSVRRFLSARCVTMADAACVRVSDGNGYPLQTQPYVRTVYTAFPPEDMPG